MGSVVARIQDACSLRKAAEERKRMIDKRGKVGEEGWHDRCEPLEAFQARRGMDATPVFF